MADLTKSLTQIVSSLMQLIAATKQTSLQPEAPKIKKTPQMTYYDFLRKVLAGKEPLPVSSKKMSFRLQEDLQLLLQLSQHTHFSDKTFDAIVANKRINRTADSLKGRYYNELEKIDEGAMKKLVSWIEEEGIEGYLSFNGNDFNISKKDPKQSEKQKPTEKKGRQASLDKESHKTDKVSKKFLTNIPSSCKELNEVLRLYSKMVGVPVKTLAHRLDQVSGDLVALDHYIETKDPRILWTEQEDDIIRKGGQQLQILRRYRGDAVDKRKKYLGIA